MCLVGGMYLSGASGKISRAAWAWAISKRRPSSSVGIDLERVAESDLPALEPGVEGEPLVDELRGEDGGRLLDGVGRRQVVVFARVDDDAGRRVDAAREVLVDEGPEGIDVAEDDAVERVVQHHVEPFERAHRRDLGHAEARAVVHEADVTADLRLEAVERRAHQPEVLLGREGAAEAARRGAVRARDRGATGRSIG